jgi:hypothetical protein
MMFQSQVQFPVTATIKADVADDTFTMWVAPAACEVVSFYVALGATITAGPGTGLLLKLQNGGTSGTATTGIGTVGGGTADTGWVADTTRAGTLGSNAQLAAGEALTFAYDETGTVDPVWLHVTANVRYGTS